MTWVARPRHPVAGLLFLCVSLASAPLEGAGRVGVPADLFATSPTAVTIFPPRGSLNVLTMAEIFVAFSQPMDHASITSQTVRVVGERFGPYDVSISFQEPPSGTTMSVFTTTPLAIGERITVTLTPQIRSLALQPLVPHAWTFTTACQPGAISFAQDSAYFAARLPFEMFATDVNRDGYSDFAVAYTPTSAGTLGVFTDDADATLDFTSTTLFKTAPGPRGIWAGDLDGDDHPDICMTTSGDSGFVVFDNNGLGGFPDTSLYKTSILAYNVSGADLDLDGDLDLAMGNLQGPQVLLAWNDGAGNFGNFTMILADSSPRGIETSDLDDDGDPDLLAVNANGKVSVFENLGGGAFGSDTTYGVGLRPLSIYVNDLNGDGHPDAAVSNVQGGSISLLMNLGDGRLGPGGTIVVDPVNVGPGKNTLFEVYGNDFDGDGDIDLATANWFTGRYVILSNNGLGQFQTAIVSDSIGVGLQNIVGGDLDRDGDIDLAISNWAVGTIRVFRNGPALPTVAFTDPSPFGLDLPLQGDVRARFSTEMVGASLTESSVFLTTSQRGRAVVNLSYDAPQRTLHVSSRTRFFPGEIVTCTLGDGVASVIGPTLGPYAWTFAGTTAPGGAHFTEVTTLPLAWESASLLPGSFNAGDEIDFVAVRREPGEICRYLNAGGNTFVAGVSEEVAARIAASAAGDFDGDGDTDVAVADDLGGVIRVLLTEDSAMGKRASSALAGTPTALTSADLNHDGWTDLVFGTSNADEFGVWWNSSAGFGPTTNFSLQTAPRDIEALDTDLDGDVDLAVLIGSPPGIRLYRGLATGFFSFAGFFSVPGSPCGVVAGELSGDGKPDLVVADSAGSSVYVLRSTGSGVYSVIGPIAAAAGCSDVGLADLNGDLALDVVSVGPGATEARILFGHGDGTFGQDSTVVLSAVPSALAMGDFSSAGRQEILAAVRGAGAALVLANSPTTGVGTGTPPAVTRLLAARPNPANPLTEIAFDLATPSRARLRVFNVEGALVRTLLDRPATAGRHAATWDGRDGSGRPVASGLYLYQLEAGPYCASGKVVILR